MFWRTDCSHCREFEPELEEYYKKYKSAGLEIIGISLDQDEATWKNYLADHPMKWTNLRPSSMDQRMQIVTNFPVPGTPTIIVVDKNFMVKNRMIIRQTIEEYLKEELSH
jgi:thiol-disulfide isomerase/thioredoxin